MTTTREMFPSNPSPKIQTLIAYLEGYEKFDTDQVLAQLSDDSFEYFTLPDSTPGASSYLTKDAFAECLVKEIMPMIEAYKMTVHEIIESEDKLVIRGSSMVQMVKGGAPKESQGITIFHFRLPSKADSSSSSRPLSDPSNDNTAVASESDAKPDHELKPLISCIISFSDSLALLNLGLRYAAKNIGEEATAMAAFKYLDVPAPQVKTRIVTRGFCGCIVM